MRYSIEIYDIHLDLKAVVASYDSDTIMPIPHVGEKVSSSVGDETYELVVKSVTHMFWTVSGVVKHKAMLYGATEGR